MKPLTISDAPTVILGLQDEIRRNPESRYNHRLHGLLLIAQGMSGLQVAQLLGMLRGPSSIGFGASNKRAALGYGRRNALGVRGGSMHTNSKRWRRPCGSLPGSRA